MSSKFHFERQFASEVVYAVEFGDGDGGVCGDVAVSFEFGLFAAPFDHVVGGDADNGDVGAVDFFWPSQRRRESILGFPFLRGWCLGFLEVGVYVYLHLRRLVWVLARLAVGVLPIRRTTEKELKLFHTLG
jgi:hypothetical protein